MSLVNGLVNLLFPPKCPFCGRVVDRPGSCETCRKTLPWLEHPRQTLAAGIPCASPLEYDGAVRECMLRLKFQGASGVAEPLGELLARCAAEEFSGEFDTVTWVPLSGKRLKKRGYDQCRVLAEAACRLWQIRPEPMLAKNLDNPPQSGTESAAARRANVLGVYSVLNPERVKGRRILLIDDIVTTGATLNECCRELRDAGAAKLVCVTVARSPERHEPGHEGHT